MWIESSLRIERAIIVHIGDCCILSQPSLSPTNNTPFASVSRSFVEMLLRECQCDEKLLQSKPEHAQVEIDVFDVVQQRYPEDYSKVDAVVISGSISAAYDPDPWIQRLMVFFL